MNSSKIVLLPAFTLAAAVFFPVYAADHTALDGTWKLVPTQSEYAGQPVIQTGTVTIKDHEGVVIVTRNFAYEGAHENFFYADEIGTENKATIHAGDLKTKTKWDHGVLKVTSTLAGAVTVETYSLGADGTMRTSVVRPDHKTLSLTFQRE